MGSFVTTEKVTDMTYISHLRKWETITAYNELIDCRYIAPVNMLMIQCGEQDKRTNNLF